MEIYDQFSMKYFSIVRDICESIDQKKLSEFIRSISELKARAGRLFIIGVGGSAGNAGHAVNDFRKLANIEAYAPSDNVSELTARTNDEGWESVFTEWCKVSRLDSNDAILILSVGGGNIERNVSLNISSIVMYARGVGATILGIVGKSDGETAKYGDSVIVVPTIDPELITPMSESFQALVWHMVVMHPEIKSNPTKW